MCEVVDVGVVELCMLEIHGSSILIVARCAAHTGTPEECWN